MSKKLIIIFAINIFLFLFFTKDTFAYCSPSSWFMALCKQALGPPKDKCCRESSCSGTGCGATGTIYQWEFCKAVKCCATQKKECNYYECYTDYRFVYTYEKCSTADTCKGDCFLYPGICSDSGCTVGGKYKICCKPDGSCCTCLNGKNTGTCPSGC